MQRLLALVGIVSALIIVDSGRVSAAGQIEWRLANPFRLFKNPDHTDAHRKLFEALSARSRKTPILAAERALQRRFGGRGWAEGMFNHTCYDQNADRYDACANYVLPKSHRIVASYTRKKSVWNFFRQSNDFGGCRWSLESADGQRIAGKTAPCTAKVSFDIPYPGGARLSVAPTGSGSAASEYIKVRDLLVVGLGDSFGAGEGNPDDPVRFNDQRAHDYGRIAIAASGETVRLDGYPARAGNWSQLRGPAFRSERARWWDRECHRSLYSHQFRAALQLAVENPRRAVTYLSFSCAGAEILQGVLLRAPVRECTRGESYSVPPQISALSRELCAGTVRDARMPAAIIQRMPELRRVSESDMRLTRCRTVERNGRRVPDLKRPIDVVLLSIGGNDVGFTPLVADSILSGASIYRKLGERTGSVYGVDQARERIDLLKKRFDGLKFALKLFFGLGADTEIVLTGYPNMGYDADGMSACRGRAGMELFPPFRLDAAKVGKAQAFAKELNASLAALAGRDWTFVDGFNDDFRARGLCASDGESAAENLSFPIRRNGEWQPYKPSAYPAYTPRQRWFRTPNDAFLTSHMHAQAVSNFGGNCSGVFSGALKALARRHWQAFQLFLASTYGGAFHPTAEGQARMADAVVKALRGKLDERD